MNYKKIAALCCTSLLALGQIACASREGAESPTAASDSVSSTENLVSSEATDSIATPTPSPLIDTTDLFTERDLASDVDLTDAVSISLIDNQSTCQSENVIISGNTITITKAGIYLIFGSLMDGQIVVDAPDEKVQLVFQNAAVTSKSSAAIYVKEADKVFLTLADESYNTFTSSGEFIAIDENDINAAVFSKSDLTINGAGSLSIACSNGHGIVSKDDLKITDGTYTIESNGHALNGKDSIRILNGNFTLISEKDGLHSENKKDDTKGYIYIADGSFSIRCSGDGIDASSLLQIDGGTFDIVSGGGNINATPHADDFIGFGNGGTTTETDDTSSQKAIKSDKSMMLSTLAVSIDSADDAIHSGDMIYIMSGSYDISTGDDAFHADSDLTILDGDIQIPTSYEGLEGLSIAIYGGNINLTASDDGLNAAGGNDASGFGGFGGGMEYSSDNQIVIYGGTLTICAEGDGIDSNGDITVYGGNIYVDGPSNSANAPLDWGGSCTVHGGTLIACGAGGMAEAFSESCTQGAILHTFSTSLTGEVALTDKDGSILLSYTPSKSFNCVMVSCAKISAGETYTLSCGTETATIEMTGITYGSGSGFGNGFGGHGMGEGKHKDFGTPPENGTRPNREETPSGEGAPENFAPPQV